ncbi:MAG: mitochondrial fission ELM1 family protein [Robiginitomaculum sp.]
MAGGTLNCLVISDGRRGIENQALGLAQAAGTLRALNIETRIISHKGLMKACPPRLQLALWPKPKNYGLPNIAPHIAIGCGRQAIAPLRALKAARGADIFTVYVQDPRVNCRHFDMVIAPEHDGLSGANVETMIGSPSRVNAAMLAAAKAQFNAQLSTLPASKIAVLIGGASKSRALSKNIHAQHLAAICALVENGHGVMITTSRRTPDWAVADYRAMAQDIDSVWFYEGGEPNPYFAFLASADAILITEESTNMLTEACATGAPVFRLPMGGQAGKFEQLYSALKTRCHLTPFDGVITAKPYAPLNETARMAQRLWTRYDGRKHS